MSIPPRKPGLGFERSSMDALLRAKSPANRSLVQGGIATSAPPGPGEIITAETLTEGTERRLIRNAPGKVVLAPYAAWEPNRPPVILVHGLATPRLQTWLAERLHKESGRQVLMVFFDDMGTRLHLTGRYMAERVVELLRNYPPDVHLAIAGQCVGGIAARCALNYLWQPGWYGETGSNLKPPAGLKSGTTRIGLYMVDSKRGGFFHEPPNQSAGLAMRVVRFILSLFGLEATLDYRATSLVYSRLYAVRLPPNVTIRNYTAAKPPGTQAFGTVTELDAQEALALARFLVHRELPSDGTPRLRNLALALEQEQGYQAFKAAFRERLGSSSLEQSPEAIRKALAGAYSAKMLHFPALKRSSDGTLSQRGALMSHVMSLTDDPSQGRELIDVLVRDLTVR